MKTDTKELDQKLLRACETNNCEEIRTLIKQGTNINCGDEMNSTPIYIAAYNGHVEAIKTLKELGADVNKAKLLFMLLLKWVKLKQLKL
jgi:ankyrin repeat protein